MYSLARIDKIVQYAATDGFTHGYGLGGLARDMCALQAVNYWMTGQCSDMPDCVDPDIRTFILSVNDCQLYDSATDRGRKMYKLVVASVGSTLKNCDWHREFYKKSGAHCTTPLQLIVKLADEHKDWDEHKVLSYIIDCMTQVLVDANTEGAQYLKKHALWPSNDTQEQVY